MFESRGLSAGVPIRAPRYPVHRLGPCHDRRSMARAAKRTRDAVAHASSEATAAPRRSAGAGSSDPLVGDLRRGGLLPLLVLHFAAQEACYGNQLIERIATVTDGTVAVNPN